MKAILLAGGQGTRLRPLTLHTPKPIVPIFNRPFLTYQIDLIRQIPDITEIILSLNYQPRRIEDVFGDGSSVGVPIRYLVEPAPLGTGGAIKFAEPFLDDTVVVFNGDVLTEIDLGAVIAQHRARKARATIVLTTVENPTAYGLVETDADSNVTRFLEKPKADEITCNTINAGIYVLEPETFDRIPKDTNYSIERLYFPSLVERKETFVAYVYRGYWIDIGTPEKYTAVHRDIMDGRFTAPPFDGDASRVVVSPSAKIADGVVLTGPCFIDDEVVIKAGCRVGAHSVIGRGSHLEEGVQVDGSIIWPSTWIGRDAVLKDAIVGRNAHIGRNAQLGASALLGDKTVLTDYTRA